MVNLEPLRDLLYPPRCPVCGKGAGWQEGQVDQKKTLAKK